MSRINILGTIEHIKSRSSVYTPIIEAVVNSVESIIESSRPDGEVEIILIRQKQQNLNFDGALQNVESIEIRDNGVGFTQKHRDSFDTFYSEQKKAQGGKGFGRFMYLKYFNEVKAQSVYVNEEGEFYCRKFKFGKKFEIIADETNEKSSQKLPSTSIFLNYLREGNSLDKNIGTIARKILERILILFIDDTNKCPVIKVREQDDSQSIILNNFLKDADSEITLVNDKPFAIQGRDESERYDFKLKVFKLYFAGSARSKVSLSANKREVTDTNLHLYYPEFEDDFYDEILKDNNTTTTKNYIIKSYVLGKYLDDNVNLERETFNFPKDAGDMHYALSQKCIESEAAKLTATLFEKDVKVRTERQQNRIHDYVITKAPWHMPYIGDLEFTAIPYNADDETIDGELHKAKFRKEQVSREELKIYLSQVVNAGVSLNGNHQGTLKEVVKKINKIGQSDLVHYVCSRKLVLDAFDSLRKRGDDGKSKLEKEIHNMIFPMGKDSETISYESHNLWLLDERLVFSEYIASDRKVSKKDKDALGEPDLVIFDKPRSFRNGENAYSNPLTIFEFKRPKRKGYTDSEDPIKQIGDYLIEIRKGKYEMPEGLETIKVNDQTPVYGYVICDIVEKIKEFAMRNQLTLSPDNEGYFGYHTGYKMYVEVISYKKLVDDAILRNKIFFKKLQLV